MKRYCLSVLLLFICVQAATIRARADDPRAGYALLPHADHVDLAALSAAGHFTTLRHLAAFACIEAPIANRAQIDCRSLRIAPTGQWLAFAALRAGHDWDVWLYDALADDLKRYSLPMMPAVDIKFIWSPDSTTLLITPGVSGGGRTDTLALDVATGQFTPLFPDFSVGLAWLPDSEHFAFVGNAVCGRPCDADGDLYLGQQSAAGTQALTRLDVSALDLPPRSVPYWLGIGNYAWAPRYARFFFEIGEPYDFNGVELLYSVNLAGDFRFEADIRAVYPDSYWPTELKRIFSVSWDDALYILTTTAEVSDEVSYRWSILRYLPGGKPTIVYEKDFAASSDLNSIATYALASDTRRLALGTADSRIPNTLVVVDLKTRETVFERTNMPPVCTVRWADANTLLYGPTTSGYCLRFRDVMPLAALLRVDLRTGITTEIWAGDSAPLYYSPIPPTP